MKKKLSLLMIIFMAVTAFAVQATNEVSEASETTWTVAGKPASLFGTEWDPTAAANDMTLADGVYKWTKTDVTLAAQTEVAFKVCKDHAWTVAYPGSDYKLTIPADGVYTVEITFDGNETVNAVATKTGDAEIGNAEITKAQICGATDADWKNRIDFDLTKGEGDVYSGTLSVAEPGDDVEFKLVVNESTWIGNGQATLEAPEGWVENMGNGNFKLKNSVAGYASYTFTATWVPNAIAGNGWTVKIEGKDARTKDVTIAPESGDISAALASELGGNAAKNITINLAENGAYTISAPIEATADVVINGAKGAKIDASALTGAFINYASVNGEKAMKADGTTASDYTIVNNVKIANVEINGLANSFINNSAGKILFKKVLVDNVVAEIVGSNTIFALGNAYPEDLKITNSTLWSKGEGHKGFLFQSHGKAPDINPDYKTSWTIDKSTLYQIGVGKKANNTNVFKGKNYLALTLTNSILYNFGSNTNNEVNGWLFGQNSTSPSITYANNTYWSAEGAVAGWTDSSKGGSDQTGTALTTDPGFTAEKVAAGDFTIGASTAQAKMKTGDPRWLVDFVAPEGATVQDIVLDAEAGDISKQLTAKTYEVINALNTVGNVTINLAENGAYTISTPIDVTKNVAINGAKGAKIDASALTGSGLINYATVVGAKAMKDETTESAYTIVEKVTIKDVEISGLKKSVINSSAGKVLFKDVLVSNAVIEMAGNVNVFGLGGGYPENLKIENSTIWSNDVHKSFFFKADGKPADVNSEATTTWTVDHSTLANIAIGKKANNSNGGIKGKATTLMVLTNSILYNFGSNTGNEVNGWLWGQNGGAKSTYSSNTYWSAEGAVAGWTDSSKGGSDQTGTALTTDPGFTAEKVAAGDFTIGASTAQAKMKTGDPRWLVDFVAPEGATVQDIVLDAEAGDISKQLTAKTYEVINALNTVGNVTINLAENGAYTISTPIDVTKNVAINGAKGAKIDASALTGSGLINYATVVGAKAMKDETTESAYTIVEKVTIKDVEISGLKKSVINSSAGKVLFKDVLVSNAVIEMAGNVNVFGLGGGYPENLKIENSTIWSNDVHKSFFFKADGKPADVNSEATTTWTVDHSTLANIAIGKKANNSNGGIKGKATTLMVLTNSILYNFGSNTGNEVNGWLWGQNGGAKSTYANNTYWSAEGAVAGWTDESKGGSDQTGTALTTDPGFTAEKVAAGDFTLGASTEQAKEKTGDPRWLVEYVPSAINAAKVNAESDDAAVYSLSGQRVSKAYKGVVIKNGRKVVVK